MSSPTTKKPIPSLLVLRDEPLFGTSKYDAARDTFAYEAFAKALLEVLNSNEPPLSVGLFGPWGIGKSTIINILFSKIAADSSSQLFPIYFNAWKYSGDSFRRQFLLDVARKVYNSPTHEAVQRLERLNYTDVLATKSEASWVEELKAILTGKVLRARRGGLIRILLGLFLLLMGSIFSVFSSSAYPAITAAFAALVIFVFKLKFEDVFAIQENQVFDPKLIFPEQFEKEFQSLISPNILGGKRAVIIIDDIDRCESATIRDILISTKNFVGHANAYFIIPCDDLKVVNIFDDEAHKSGYRDEMLRKYFNVGLRIPPISNQDLIDFANRMARDTKLPEEVVQLAVLADYRDARRIKHFANNFLIKLQIARARSESKHLPSWTADRDLQLAKLVIIEDCAPPVFSKIAQNPPLLQLLEQSALSPSENRTQLSEHQLGNWEAEYPGLKKALIGARYVTISDLELLLSLKADNLELRVPSGAQFRKALLQGSHDTITSLLPEISARTAQQPLADLIEDSLRRATGPLLANCIACSLNIDVTAFFAGADARRVARQIGQRLLHEGQRIWVQSGVAVTSIFDLLEGEMIKGILNKYVNELRNSPDQPKNLVETTAAIFPKLTDKKDFIFLLNDKFTAWSSTEVGLAALNSLSEMRLTAEEGIVFPSKPLVNAVVNTLTPTSGDIKTHALRKQIIFGNWDSSYAAALCASFWNVFQVEHSQSSFNAPLHFSLTAICEKPEILQQQYGDQMLSYLPAILNRAKNDDERNLVRDCMVVGVSFGSPGGGRPTMINALTPHWQSDTDERIRRDLTLAQRVPSDSDLSTRIMSSQTDAVARELQGPTERTRQRLQFIEEFQQLAPANFINQQLTASLSVNSEPAYSFWESVIRSRRERFSPSAAAAFITTTLDLVSSSGTSPLNSRKASLLKLAIEFFPTQSAIEVGAFTRRILEMLWHSDDAIRAATAATLSFLRVNANLGDVRISLNAGISDNLRKVSLSTFTQYQPVIDALVSNKDLWNESSQRAITQLALALSSNDGLRPSALTLLESVDQFSSDDLGDVVHVLNTIEAAHSGLRDRAHTLMQRIAPDSNDET